MDGRGTVCAHCADAEAEEPCSQCLCAICISCLLDRAPCRKVHPPTGEHSVTTQALRTLAACGIAVSGERLVGSDVPLWLIESVRVTPIGDPKPGRADVLAVTVSTRSGESVEVLRRSEAADVDEVHAVARALAQLAGTRVIYQRGEEAAS